MRSATLGPIALALLAQFAPAPARTVEGRVIHTVTGEPLRGAIVSAYEATPETKTSRDAAFLTGADGTFVLRSATAPLTLLVTKTGYLDAHPPPASNDRGASLVIRLTPAASITGGVLDPAGDPVRGATVRAAIKGETLEARARLTTTDDRGQYMIDGLTAAEYVVTAGRTSGKSMTQPHPYPASATLEIGEERGGVDLQVPWEDSADALALIYTAAQKRSTGAVGTASIAGTVRHRQGRGVASVFVTAWLEADPRGTNTRTWSALTDEHGAFVIEKLPAGTFSIMAHRRTVGPPWGTTPLGVPAKAIQLADGQRQSDVHITVRDGGSIAGVIRDEFGDPVRASVTLLAANVSLGVGGHATITTDDRGRYRFADLLPNRYLVMAMRATTSPVLAGTGSGQSRLVGRAPYFYPGVPSIDLAAVISIGVGSEADGVDLTVAYEPVADVAFSVVTTAVELAQVEARQVSLDGRPSIVQLNKNGDPAVLFGNVAAGHWRFTVGATLSTPNGPETQWALHEATTDGLTRHGATLTPEASARVSGKIVFDGAGQLPASEAIFLTYLGGPVGSQQIRFNALIKRDGTFEFRDVMPGAYAIEAAGPGGGWTLGGATVNGQDVLDLPLQLAPGADVSGVLLTMTTRATELSGVVTDAAGRRLAETELVIVPADPRYHWPGSRRLGRIMTGADGTYTVRGLPAGDYRIGPAPRALTGAALIQFPRPIPTLEVKLAAGERKIQNLTVSR